MNPKAEPVVAADTGAAVDSEEAGGGAAFTNNPLNRPAEPGSLVPALGVFEAPSAAVAVGEDAAGFFPHEANIEGT